MAKYSGDIASGIHTPEAKYWKCTSFIQPQLMPACFRGNN